MYILYMITEQFIINFFGKAQLASTYVYSWLHTLTSHRRTKYHWNLVSDDVIITLDPNKHRTASPGNGQSQG